MPRMKIVRICGEEAGPMLPDSLASGAPAARFVAVGGRRLLRPSLALALTLLLVSAEAGRGAEAGLLHLRCANDASGASWPLVVDLDRRRVDSQAATITDRWIRWQDAKQGYWDLERATGKLQFRNASSTGGYFLYYTCRREEVAQIISR